MYFQPYGDEQQINLNWIINEIINLHKQLDPDYETPSFTQIYPYSNLNRLNLDWILSELKALKELVPEPTPTIDIQAVAKALVALPFDRNTSYQIYDFISRDGEIWRATEAIAAGGEWDSSKWFKTKIGTDLAVLDRWINTINNSLTSEIQARQDADTALQNRINALTSADISDDSDAGGANVKASLNALKGYLNSKADKTNIAYVENSFTATRSYKKGDKIIVENILYIATTNISNGATLSTQTNIWAIGQDEKSLTFSDGWFRFLSASSFDDLDLQLSEFTSRETCYFAWIHGAFTNPISASRMLVLGYANQANTYAAQVCFTFASTSLYFRRKQGNTWSDWSTK